MFKKQGVEIIDEFSQLKENNGAMKATISNDDLVQQQQIIADISVIMKKGSIKDEKGEIVGIPPLEFIGKSYEEFIENKVTSFLFLSVHPEFKGKFETEDVRAVNQAARNRGTSVPIFNIVSLFTIVGISNALYRRNPVLGLTYYSGIGPIFFKYYLFPKLLTSFVDQNIFFPHLQNQVDSITKKYEFQHQMISNPLCKKAYNDFVMYSQQKKQLDKIKN